MTKKLFTPAPSNKWRRNAIAGGYHTDYIGGYYEAANTLLKYALENRGQDLYFYPICFNYRHFLELMLKHLVLRTERYHEILVKIGERDAPLEKSVKKDIQNEHSLQKLIQWLIERLNIVEPGVPFDQGIIKTINQLHSVDPDGQTFRYPFRQDGSLTLPEQKHYDIEIIRRRMEEVYYYLGGTDAFLDHNIDLANDLLTDLNSNFTY